MLVPPDPVTSQRFPIGTTYSDRQDRTNTVVDVLRTYNSVNELVRIRYVVARTVAGRTVFDRDVCDTTIARAIHNEEEESLRRNKEQL